MKKDTVEEFKDWIREQDRNGQPIKEDKATEQYMKLVAADVDIAKLVAGLSAFVIGGDVNSAADASGVAARFNQNHTAEADAKDAMVAVIKELKIRGKTYYKIIDKNGHTSLVQTCPPGVPCYKTVGDDYTLSPEEEQMRLEAEETKRKNHERFMTCVGKPRVGECASRPLYQNLSEEEERQIRDAEEAYIKGMNTLRNMGEFALDTGIGICTELFACGAIKEVNGVVEEVRAGGSLDTGTGMVLVITAAGSYVLKKADTIPIAFEI